MAQGRDLGLRACFLGISGRNGKFMKFVGGGAAMERGLRWRCSKELLYTWLEFVDCHLDPRPPEAGDGCCFILPGSWAREKLCIHGGSVLMKVVVVLTFKSQIGGKVVKLHFL